MKKDLQVIKNELYSFIQFADERKINALYELLQEQIEGNKEWWHDKNFVAELEERYQQMERGGDKGVDTQTLLNNMAKAKLYAGR